MLTLHDDIELTCGDDWVIAGTLLDQDGAPLNLDASVGLSWTLLDPDGVPVSDLATTATLERVDPITNGQVLITISEALTATFRPGRYTDAMRVTIEDAPSTLWRGMILAGADPFYAEMLMPSPPNSATFDDAPSDGKPYVRQGGAWVEMPAPLPDAPSDGKPYVRQNGAWIEALPGFSVTFEYTFAKQTTAPPTNSQARLDNLDPTLVAKIWLNNNDANSIDESNLIGMAQPGYFIFLQDKDNPALWARYTVTGLTTNTGAYCEIPVSYVASVGTLNDNQRIIVFVYGGG